MHISAAFFPPRTTWHLQPLVTEDLLDLKDRVPLPLPASSVSRIRLEAFLSSPHNWLLSLTWTAFVQRHLQSLFDELLHIYADFSNRALSQFSSIEHSSFWRLSKIHRLSEL